MILAPKYVLTRHFWTTPKYKQFLSSNLISKSQAHFVPLLSNIKLKDEISLPVKLSDINDNNISISQLEEMNKIQLYHLLRFYQISPFNGITKLKERALLIHCLDNKLKTENNNSIDTMDEREIVTQLYLRRIIFANEESIDILRERLKEWLKYSDKFYKSENESFSLYVPVLIQGNQH
ncbi:Hypothetical protein SRAE_2000184700 [Strongyloides ratti]|uniref:LETM1 domain-containing protein n=1 Tax=Strongyloides ratti TaxID=34506 RepID=A0A090LBS5_STRRB|nr:Hypothetical protein SRAE_2000184700 [Strongyloides ratti]CEF67182.1 Hypothetical protein SRAE_2000184700 [Strongyloides ratti]